MASKGRKRKAEDDVEAPEASKKRKISSDLMFANSIADVGRDLFQNLCQKEPGRNVFISPLSITTALTLAAAGTTEGSDTQREMRSVLHTGVGDEAVVIRECGALPAELAKGDPAVRFDMATSLWARVTSNDYAAMARDVLFADVMPLTTAAAINGWVSDKTQGLIGAVVRSIPPRTACLIVNAVYFKGTWGKKFDKRDTYDCVFHKVDGSEMKCKMMHKTFEGPQARYGETDAAQVLELPYGSKRRFAALVVLPKDASPAGLRGLVDTLDLHTWRELTDCVHQATVSVHLPRFKMEYAAELKPTLAALGMPSAFQECGGFDRIAPTVWIHDVAHRAVLEVDEEGTVAAAATAVKMKALKRARDFNEITCDRPFLFAVIDKRTHAIHFIGRVMQPGLLGRD